MSENPTNNVDPKLQTLDLIKYNLFLLAETILYAGLKPSIPDLTIEKVYDLMIQFDSYNRYKSVNRNNDGVINDSKPGQPQ